MTTYIGMTYEDWRKDQEAQGFKGKCRSRTVDRIRRRQFTEIAREGMFGYADTEYQSVEHPITEDQSAKRKSSL